MKIIKQINNIIIKFKDLGVKKAFAFYLYEVVCPLIIVKWKKFHKNSKISNVLTFECENDMQDNARALFDYLYENKYWKKYRLVWVVKDLEYCKSKYKGKKVEFISRQDKSFIGQMRFIYFIAKTHYFFFTHPWWLKDRKEGQTVVHLCHGAPPLKGRDVNGKSGVGESFDLILAPSEHVVSWECEFWECTEEKAIILGAPRNDKIFSSDIEKNLKPFINVDSDEKVILLMPTFKQNVHWVDSNKIDKFSLNVIDSIEQMHQLNDLLVSLKIHFLIKIHPLQNLDLIECTDYSNIHYLSNDEMYRKDVSIDSLMGSCDALVTDFSSVYMEYLLLNRPVAFFVNSIQEYKRGYIMDNPDDYMPGDKISNFEQLILFVINFSNGVDKYALERQRVNELINKYKDNNNCERLVDYFDL